MRLFFRFFIIVLVFLACKKEVVPEIIVKDTVTEGNDQKPDTAAYHKLKFTHRYFYSASKYDSILDNQVLRLVFDSLPGYYFAGWKVNESILISNPCEINVTEETHVEIKLTTLIDSIKLKMRNKEKVTIVCFGSSTTYGNYPEYSYPQFLEDTLRKYYKNNNISVLNFGKGGWTMKDAYNAIDTLLQNQNPDIVTLMFGVNDYGASSPISDYERYFGIVLDRILASNVAPVVLSPQIIKIVDLVMYRSYCEGLEKVSFEKSALYFDLNQHLMDYGVDSTMFWLDNLHPTKYGLKLISDEIFSFVFAEF